MGTVVKGKVVVDGEPLSEGSRVTILIGEGRGEFDQAPGQVEALRRSIAQADEGDLIDGDKLLEEIVRDR